VCQCNSRTPPAVNLISTPAIDFETGSSRTVTSRDHPPSCIRLCDRPKGYLKLCTPPASEAGGKNESGFCASSGRLPGPGALALRSFFVGYCFCSCAATSAADSIPAAAIPADPIPKNPRRESMPFVESSFITVSLSEHKLRCDMTATAPRSLLPSTPNACISFPLLPARRPIIYALLRSAGRFCRRAEFIVRQRGVGGEFV